jgi:hypothetical protein
MSSTTTAQHKAGKNDLQQLLQQVTRIADALELQQEFNLEQLRQSQHKVERHNLNQQIDTCTALIMAANRTGQAMKTVDHAMSKPPHGPDDVERKVDAFAAIEQGRRQELAAAVNDYLGPSSLLVGHGIDTSTRSLAPFARNTQLDAILNGSAFSTSPDATQKKSLK